MAGYRRIPADDGVTYATELDLRKVVVRSHRQTLNAGKAIIAFSQRIVRSVQSFVPLSPLVTGLDAAQQWRCSLSSDRIIDEKRA